VEATRVRSEAGFASWRELARTPTHLVPALVGSALAVIVSVLTYIFAMVAAGQIVAVTLEQAYLFVFGIIGLIGYSVAKQNVQNGSIVSAVAGLALVGIAADAPGVTDPTVALLTGFLLLAGAIWSLAATR
jgi:hypothetical protein